MILKAYSAYDVKAESYMPPFFLQTHGLATRQFADAANNRETSVGRYPDDFKLVHIGTFDDHTGIFTPCDPVTLGFGRDYIRKDERQLSLVPEVAR